MGPFSRVNFHSTTKKCAKEKQVAIAKKGTGMPRRRYYSYSPWLRTAQRSARLGTLLGGIALGLSTAVGILFVLKNAQKRPITPVPIQATATATVPAPAPETVEPASETHPSPSAGKATDVSASDHVRSAWSLQLIGDSSETRALEKYRNLQERFPAILASRTPVIVKRELGGRGSVFWYQVRLAEESRERASALCAQLRAAGGECLLLRDLP